VSEPPLTRHLSYRALLGIPWVARILLSLAIGRIAASMASVVLVVFALQRFDSPAVAGLIVFASTAPAVVMGPIAGALLDRHGRVRLVILDQAVGAAAVLLVAILAAIDQLPVLVLVAIAGLASFTRPLSITGLRTLLPVLVPPALWPRVNALDSNAFVLATLLGPAAGGAAIAIAGPVGALLAVSVLLLAAGLALVGIPEQAPGTSSGRGLLTDAWEGVRYTWRNATLRGLAGSMVLYYAGFGVLTVTVPVLLLDRLGQDPAIVGLAWSAMALAGGAAAFIVGAREGAGRERRWLALAMAGTALGSAALLAPASVVVVFAALLVAGAMQGPVDIAMFTLRQRRTQREWFGRAFAVSVALNSAGSPIAAAVAGVLLASSVEAAVGLAIALFLAGSALAVRLVPAEDTAHLREAGATRG
jgi:MFS family permease